MFGIENESDISAIISTLDDTPATSKHIQYSKKQLDP